MRIIVRYITRKTKGGATHRDQSLEGSRLTLGRGTDQDIHLPNLRVALAHAELREGADRKIRLQSHLPSGFRYNGAVTQLAVLEVGDRVEIGSFHIAVAAAAGHDLALEVAEDASTRGRELEAALRERSVLLLHEAGLRKRPWALAGAGTILVLFLLIPLLAAVVTPVGGLLRKVPLLPSDHAWSSGEVSQAHAHFAERCDACHTVPFVPARNAACVQCHERTPHHVGQAVLDTGLFDDARCADCHHEHTGKASIVRRDEGLCVACHADMPRVLPGSKLASVEHFSDAHPEFKATLIRHVGDKKLALRVSLAGKSKLVESPNLEFSHQGHLKAEGVKHPDRGRVKLACADCHEPEPGGGRMAPVRFEAHCQSCHRLTIPGDTEREVPHGDLKAALGAIDDYYLAWALKGGYPNEFAPAVVRERRRPGRPLAGPERQEALAWASRMSELATGEMLAYTTCAVCHQAEPTGKGAEAWRLMPVEVPETWFPKSRFSHGQHQTMPCADCHRDVPRTDTSAAVMLPGIEDCRGCHGGADAGEGKLASTCITCHEFHRAAPLLGAAPTAGGTALPAAAGSRLKSVASEGRARRKPALPGR